VKESRTVRQIQANRLDLVAFRMAGEVERFAEEYAPKSERSLFKEIAADIRFARHQIRKHMHPKDREATS